MWAVSWEASHVQAAAVRAAEAMTEHQGSGPLVMTAFNAGSPMHKALLTVATGCLGRAQAWVLLASDDVDSAGRLVDNLVALKCAAPPFECVFHAALCVSAPAWEDL